MVEKNGGSDVNHLLNAKESLGNNCDIVPREQLSRNESATYKLGLSATGAEVREEIGTFTPASAASTASTLGVSAALTPESSRPVSSPSETGARPEAALCDQDSGNFG